MGRIVRLVAAGVLLLCLALCTGRSSPTPSVGPSSGGAPPASLSPGQLSAIEEQLMQQGMAGGYHPGGDPVVTYLHGQDVRITWPTDDQSLCEGYNSGSSRRFGCYINWHIPVDTTPRLLRLWGPESTDVAFLTVFLAIHEEARSLSCGGVSNELKRVGEIKTPGDTSLAVYSYVTPFLPDGTFEAEVIRDNGPAIEQVGFGDVDSPVNRDWFRPCELRAIDRL